ncbi:MAG TPA: hypothetical protein PKV76_06925 [Chitinophagales bacterium]|nr:hypothetical protein [Chitinophagales bacterium]
MLIFSYNIDLDGAEFTFVHYIQQLLKGEPLYLNPYEAPFSITIYTPLYLHLVEAACRFLEVNYIDNIYKIFITGRIISFGFTILGVYYIYLFAKKYLTDNALILFACALYLLLITGHSYAVRPDSMKLAFFIAFLYYFIDYFFESGNASSKLRSLVFGILCIAAKQDAFIYIGLFLGVTFLVKRTKQVFIYLVVFAFSVCFLFLLFHIIYGKYCLSSLFLFNLQGISDYKNSYNFLIVIFNTFRLSPFYLLFIYILVCKKKNNQPLIITFAITGFFAALLSSFFLFRPGSYLNYTYELIAIALVTTIIFIKNRSDFPKKIYYLTGIYVLLIFASNTVLNIYTINFDKEDAYKAAFSEYYQLRKDLIPLLEKKASIFNPELQQSIFIADFNVIYGQEYHLDRLIYGLLGLKTTSKLMTVSSKQYDEFFTNGQVDYLVTKDNERAKELIVKHYPAYKPYLKKGNYIIYSTQTP